MTKQQRMIEIVERMQNYWNTYSDQRNYQNYSDEKFLLDAIYGLGIAISRDDYFAANGFDKVLEFLTEFLAEQKKPERPSEVMG